MGEERTRRAVPFLAVALALSALVPGVAYWAITNNLESACTRLSERAERRISIGSIEVSLSGAAVLREVHAGDAFRADAIEAYPDPATLFSERPRVALVHLLRPRLRWRQEGGPAQKGPRSARPPSSRPLPKITVTDGRVELLWKDRGTIVARDVEIQPSPRGLRVRAGTSEGTLAVGPVQLQGEFASAAADLAWPSLAPERFLAVGGTLVASPAAHPVALRRAALSIGLDGQESILEGQLGTGSVRARLVADTPALRLSLRDVPVEAVAPLLPPWVSPDGGHVSTEARVNFTDRQLTLAGTARNVTTQHPRVSRSPVALDGAVHVELGWQNVSKGVRFRVSRLDIKVSGIQFHGQGSFVLDDGAPQAVDAMLELPESPCGKLLAAIPAPWTTPIAGLELTGKTSLKAALSYDVSDLEGLHLSFDVDPKGCRVHREPDHADPRCVRPSPADCPPSRLAALPFVPLKTLPDFLPRAMVLAEDGRFFAHGGFDVGQIAKSLATNLSEGRLRRGGSTISQQVVKNLYLHPRRTVARKLIEVILTWRLEAKLSKRAILEQYVNLVELAPGVRGIANGAAHWFEKPAKQLTPREAALLAVLLPAPTTYAARIRAHGGLDAGLLDRVDRLLVRMQKQGILSASDAKRARNARVRFAPQALRPTQTL